MCTQKVVGAGVSTTGSGTGCDAPLPTCGDGIFNGAETGVDCGGPDCPSCACDYIVLSGETGVYAFMNGVFQAPPPPSLPRSPFVKI